MEKYYWLFYLKREKEKRLFKDFTRDNLYAYALDKKIAKKFKEERNMDMFVVKKIVADKKVLCSLTNDFQGGILKVSEFKTRSFSNHLASVSLVVTDQEASYTFATTATYIYNPGSILGIDMSQYIPLKILKKKYRDALNTIQFGYFSAAVKGDVLLAEDGEFIIIDRLEVLLSKFNCLFKT